MSNFDLTKYLAEGKLYEAMSPQDVVDIADTVAEEFTKESADKGDFMVYSVGEMDVDDMSFELDTDTTAQTPERILKMSNLGVGEGWGGSFRINPKEEGYEVRNSEKGGLVAIIDNMGNFKMLSADESRAEMGRAKGEETDYMERRRETDDYMQEGKMLNEGMLDTIKDKLVSVGKKLLNKFSPEEQASMKAAAEKVLGPNYSKEDLTLDKAKEIGKIISGGLDESQELDENLRKKIGATLLGLGIPTAFIAGHGFGGTDAGAITAGIGAVAAMIGMVMVNVDEAQETPKSTKMKKSELKEDMSIEDVYNDAKRQVKDIHNIDVPMDVVKQWADNYQFPYSREEDPNDEDNYILVYDFGTEERGDFMEWLKDNGLREDEVKEIKSNKMKKSELKEMIKAAMSENARTDAEEEGYLDGMRDEKEDMKEAEDVEVEDDENIDVDIEKDIKVDDEESEVDIDVKASMPGESEDVEEVQALLMKAQEQARDLGDEKLMDQIGNTITYFTRAHVAGNVSEMDDMDVNVNTTEMEAEMGLEEVKDEEVKENLNESMFPMWNKIK